jgi:hypothetical protein
MSLDQKILALPGAPSADNPRDPGVQETPRQVLSLSWARRALSGPSRHLRVCGARGGASLVGPRGSPGRWGRTVVVRWRRGRAGVA